MEKKYLEQYKIKIGNLSMNEKKLRNIYLRNLSLGNVQGPVTGYPSIDKPWLKYYSEESIIKDIPNNLSFYEFMKYDKEKYLNKTALNYYGKKYTYEEMFKKIDEFASKYKNMGIKSGHIISICMPSTPETVFSIYALNKIGAICDMMDPRSNKEQMEYYLKENKSKVIILCENYYSKFQDTLDKFNLNNVILLPITPSAPINIKTMINIKTKIDGRKTTYSKNVINWNEFSKICINDKLDIEHNNEDLALIIHSSGTTSLPKGIVLTNKNINSIALQYELSSLNTSAENKFLSVIPAFASFGTVASINLPLYLSMETILVPIVTPDKFVKLIKKEKPNFCLTVPANFINLMKKDKIDDLSFLYGPGCGGYSLDSSKEKEINEYLLKHNCPSPMLMGWGMSELSSTACLETPECSKILSSGVPLVKNNISIFENNTSNELEYYQEGEICVSGPTIMHEYLNNPEKTSKTIKKHDDGSIWLHSGDIGYMDQDGRVFPVDRIDRMIVRGKDGFKIFPQKIEEVITSLKYVDSCVVVGCETELGKVPKAYVILNKECTIDKNQILENIKKICIEKLSIRAIPDEFEFIDALPYTSMGKIAYKKLERKV